jgi:hypothetical protein
LFFLSWSFLHPSCFLGARPLVCFLDGVWDLSPSFSFFGARPFVRSLRGARSAKSHFLYCYCAALVHSFDVNGVLWVRLCAPSGLHGVRERAYMRPFLRHASSFLFLVLDFILGAGLY